MQAESLKATEICRTGSESPSPAEPEKKKKSENLSSLNDNKFAFFLFNEVEHS